MTEKEPLYDVEVDVLIVGAGPAGLALATFLGKYGIEKGMVISKDNSTANTPRVHITNLSTMEVFRDMGLAKVMEQIGIPERVLGQHNRWVDTLAGRELLRSHAWGNSPHRAGDVWEASPCAYIDIDQRDMEPILLREATSKGWKARFNAELVNFEERRTGFVTATVKDATLNSLFKVKCKYLAGADGARSTVMAQLGLPLVDKNPERAQMAVNVHFKADLSHLMRDREGLLHLCFAPGIDHPPWARVAFVRAIKPWNEFQATMVSAVDAGRFRVGDDEIVAALKPFIGAEMSDFELLGTSLWKINEQYAVGDLGRGRVFCLGDAIHRHPPANGLGSNTCVQDAYNLAWKLAYVLRGQASPNVLQSYSAERQPVAQEIVTVANDTVRLMGAPWAMLGAFEDDPSKRVAAWEELLHGDSPAAQAKRKAFHALRTEVCPYEHHALGAEMNQVYRGSGVAVCQDDAEAVVFERDRRIYLKETTQPGFRLPHAWLSTKRDATRLSTQDLAGKGRFTLLTGHGGKERWVTAASTVSAKFAVEIAVFSIGFAQDYEDLYGQWQDKCGVEETGVVLVRPDRFVGWRLSSLDPSADVAQDLERAMKVCLGFL